MLKLIYNAVAYRIFYPDYPAEVTKLQPIHMRSNDRILVDVVHKTILPPFIHHLIESLSIFRNCISSEILCSEQETVADHPQSSIRVG